MRTEPPAKDQASEDWRHLLQSSARESLRAVLWLGAVLTVGLAVWIVAVVVWHVVTQPPESTGDLIGQGQVVLGSASALLSTVLVAATIYYAVNTRRLVEETRAVRKEERAARMGAEYVARINRMEGAAAALIGACSDMVALGSAFATLRGRLKHRLARAEEAMQPVTAASRALDELRYLAPYEVTVAGEELFDNVVAFYEAAMHQRGKRELEAIAREMHGAKTRVQEQLGRAVKAPERGGRQVGTGH